MFTSYLFVIGQFVLKVISYWLTANNRKLINFLSTQFFNLRKCIESIFEEHFNWNDSKEKKNLQMPGAVPGRGLVMIRVSTNYLHVAVLIRGREFDKRRDKQLLKRLYNTYSYIILTCPHKVIVI